MKKLMLVLMLVLVVMPATAEEVEQRIVGPFYTAHGLFSFSQKESITFQVEGKGPVGSVPQMAEYLRTVEKIEVNEKGISPKPMFLVLEKGKRGYSFWVTLKPEEAVKPETSSEGSEGRTTFKIEFGYEGAQMSVPIETFSPNEQTLIETRAPNVQKERVQVSNKVEGGTGNVGVLYHHVYTASYETWMETKGQMMEENKELRETCRNLLVKLNDYQGQNQPAMERIEYNKSLLDGAPQEDPKRQELLADWSRLSAKNPIRIISVGKVTQRADNNSVNTLTGDVFMWNRNPKVTINGDNYGEVQLHYWNLGDLSKLFEDAPPGTNEVDVRIIHEQHTFHQLNRFPRVASGNYIK